MNLATAIGSKTSSSFEPLATLNAAALDAIPLAVYIVDQDARIVRFNARAAELWGRQPDIGDPQERYCGASKLFRMDGSHLPHDQTPMAETLRTGKPCRDLEVVIERPDGSRVTVLVNIEPLRDVDGTRRGAINCFRDVTEHRRVQAALKDSERRLREILEALPAAIYTTDQEGRITFYNRAAAEFSGRQPIIGSDSWCVTYRLYRPDGSYLPHDQCPMAVALREQRPVLGETEAIAERPDGTRVPFIPFATPLYDADGAMIGAVNMLVDISERKQADERQRILIGELNHRVKNTLATVQSLARQTAKRTTTVAEFERSFNSRLIALSRGHDLLSRAKWEGACLKEVIQEVVRPYGGSVSFGGPDIGVTPTIALSLTLILHELATNAAKYGALSAQQGAVTVNWTEETDAEKRSCIQLIWQERDGPTVQTPTEVGFGTKLIKGTVEDSLHGELELDFHPEGFACRMRLPLV